MLTPKLAPLPLEPINFYYNFFFFGKWSKKAKLTPNLEGNTLKRADQQKTPP